MRRSPPLVVGFDLDMTLIDSRQSIRAAMTALAVRTGADIDVEHIVATLGPPLETSLAPWFTGPALADACSGFRELHGPLLHLTRPMPGAGAALEAVRRHHGQVVVVTAKYEPHARASLAAVGLGVDVVVGWLFGPAKGDALRQHRAIAYVGDHPADMAAAHSAGVTAVGVASGAATATELAEAGADIVLDDLEDFPGWLDRTLSRSGGQPLR